MHNMRASLERVPVIAVEEGNIMRKAIIVDDDRWAIADICSSFMLKKHGFELIGQCASAEEALPIILEKRPDLVITDICMGRMSGIDLIRACREKMVDAYFVVISGYDLFEYAQQAMNEGANYYLLKPIDTDEVQALMAKIELCNDETLDEATGPILSDIIRYIKQHYNENLTLTMLSEKFYIDKSYLSRIFSKNLGLTFTEFKQKLQITRAMELLDKGYGIGEVASQVGFNDVRYFFRVFKKLVGTTPYQYKSRK